MKPRRLRWDGRDIALAAELRELPPSLGGVASTVADVLSAVAERGDEAVCELTERFDSVRLSADALAVDPDEWERAAARLDAHLAEALATAAANIRAVADAQCADAVLPIELPQGHTVTVHEVPVAAAGAYVPGGRAAYPSTVLMCCIPAIVAGVDRVAVVSPPGPDGLPAPAVMAACAVAGADELYAIGGAQAIAALAYGTGAVEPVDVIVGPGNRYVTEAKRQLLGTVGIDGLAGPSELMIVLDETADIHWAALDLCAQAEHGDDGLLVAASPAAAALDALDRELAQVAATYPSVGAPPTTLVEVPDLEAAVGLANMLAPEHLQLMCADAETHSAAVRTAGCVFTGSSAATAFGDFAAGSNHVLPTGGAGRFMGALSVRAFRRTTTTVSLPPAAAAELAPTVAALARAEGFPVHGESAEARAR